MNLNSNIPIKKVVFATKMDRGAGPLSNLNSLNTEISRFTNLEMVYRSGHLTISENGEVMAIVPSSNISVLIPESKEK